MSHSYSAASHPDDLYLVNLYRSQLYLEHSELSTHSEAPPPSYDSDYSVQQITSQNRPLRPISITFSHFPNSTKKGYSNGDLIIGSLLIAPPFPINLESISISLEGEEVIRKSSWSYDQFLRRHIKLARHDFLNLPEDPVLLPNHLYTFPFSIEIPKSKMHMPAPTLICRLLQNQYVKLITNAQQNQSDLTILNFLPLLAFTQTNRFPL